MSLETEVKISIKPEDLEPTRVRLGKMGARCVTPRTKEENFLFDFPDSSLRDSGSALRLRSYGGTSLLTYKGPVQNDPRYKIREELQTSIEEPDRMKAILEALGMCIQFQYQKYREIYHLSWKGQDMEVCLDETPVGVFVEIEGDTSGIEELASSLGWSSDAFIRQSYIELYASRKAEG